MKTKKFLFHIVPKYLCMKTLFGHSAVQRVFCFLPFAHFWHVLATGRFHVPGVWTLFWARGYKRCAKRKNWADARASRGANTCYIYICIIFFRYICEQNNIYTRLVHAAGELLHTPHRQFCLPKTAHLELSFIPELQRSNHCGSYPFNIWE